MASKSFKDIYDGVVGQNSSGSGLAGNKLSMDDLSNISGGVMTRIQEKLLSMAVKEAKNKYGCTLDEVLEGIPEYYDMYHDSYPDVTMEDVTTWIEKNWDKI